MEHQPAHNKEIETAVVKTQERIAREKETRDYIPLERYPLFRLRAHIAAALRKKFPGIAEPEISAPPSGISGDFAFNAYGIAREIKKSPDAAANAASEIVNESGIEAIIRATPTGGYVNFELARPSFFNDAVKSIRDLGDRYGESDINAKKVALIEYSSPNIAKPIGVGHLRSTIIGEALGDLYNATGYSVVRENYLGDWGTQFGKVIYAFQNQPIGSVHPTTPSHGIIPTPTVRDLKDLYVHFHEEAKGNEKMEDAAREIFAKLEANDPELMELWKQFRDLSIENFKETYARFGIDFDLYLGESYFANDAQHMIERALQTGAARKDDATEAVIVDDLPGIPSFLLRKGDGSTLYIARELAALEFRIKKFNPQEILDVVGQEQELHFRQAFALAKKMNIIPETVSAKHIGFGTILTEGKKMSTRKGTLIELEDLISQSVEKSREIVKEKNPGLDEKELGEISEIVGLGAVIYNDLRQGRMRNIAFDWKRMLDFEGGSAAYLQYTYARIRSIVRKLKEEKKYAKTTGDAIFENDSEFALAKKLSLFPAIVIATSVQMSDA